MPPNALAGIEIVVDIVACVCVRSRCSGIKLGKKMWWVENGKRGRKGSIYVPILVDLENILELMTRRGLIWSHAVGVGVTNLVREVEGGTAQWREALSG